MLSLLKSQDSGFKVFVDVFGPGLADLYNKMLMAVFGKIDIGRDCISPDKFLELYSQQPLDFVLWNDYSPRI